MTNKFVISGDMPTAKQLDDFHARQRAVLDARLPKEVEREALIAINNDYLALLGFSPSGANQPSQPPVITHTARKGRRKNYESAHGNAPLAAKAAEAIVRERGRPVPLAELYHLVKARGVHLGGKHPSRQLCSILGKQSSLVSTDQGWCAMEDIRKLNAHLPWQARRSTSAPGNSYSDLALQAITEAKTPLSTPEIIAFVRQHRELPENLERRTIVSITSSFSHDERLKNIHWGDGRRWWHKDQPPPPEPQPQLNGRRPDPTDTPVNGDLYVGGRLVSSEAAE